MSVATIPNQAFISISPTKGIVIEPYALDDNTIYIGGDPGKDGAVAVLVANCLTTYRIVNKQLPDDLVFELKTYKESGWKARIAIERQGKGGFRFAAHNADAKALDKALRTRELFWGHRRTEWIVPKVWQDALGVCKSANAHKPGNRGRKTYTDYSIAYLQGLPSQSEDEHAARCILHYSLISGVWA